MTMESCQYAKFYFVQSSESCASVASANGIATPTPTQPNMVGKRDSFYLVVSGDSCAAIVSKSGISLSQFADPGNCATIAQQYGVAVAQFTSWNPAVGSSYTGLWANTHACVAVLYWNR
ncbi:hypothetical protein CORC01_03829 [Colletotrichum orchidophilum]|uniref:LysM domain-containing protein n=1 Tax=Colletotrichum orchidophilum TaxID=1209926 RepID=A0A1G4BHX4_9PEZI|nr:uncharacterized protein CORC01_03829 [Colletotrichum orchidophilum]OHF01001.1 hypothetical protein CORC01_03829 [Colletotrichum orchidophilum]